MVTSATDWFGSCTRKPVEAMRDLSSVLMMAAVHAPRLSMPLVVLDEGSTKEKLCEAAVTSSALSLRKLSGSLKVTAAPEVGASDTFTHTVSPRSKEFFGVVQSAAYVAMDSTKNGAGANVARDVTAGATRAASPGADDVRATSAEARADSARRRDAAEEPGSAANVPAASSNNIRKTLRAVLVFERAARGASCLFNCKAVVVCRDLAGLCGDVITEIFSFTFEGLTQDGNRDERKKYAGADAKNYVVEVPRMLSKRLVAHARAVG